MTGFAVQAVRWLYSVRVYIGLLTLAVSLLLIVPYVRPIAAREAPGVGYLGIFVASVLSGASLFFGGASQLAVFFMGSTYPPVTLGVIAGAGTAIGEVSGYLVGYLGVDAIAPGLRRRLASFSESRWGAIYRRWSFAVLVLLALIPNPLFDAASITAGAARLPFGMYFLAVLLGKVLRLVVLAVVGRQVL